MNASPELVRNFTPLPSGSDAALAHRLFAKGLTAAEAARRLRVPELVLMRVLDGDLEVRWKDRERILKFLAGGGR